MKIKYFRWILRFILASVVLGIILGIALHKNKPICDKCNVILVSLDTLSALHLPCYGYERNTAPNLCAYADKNILFLNSYSNAPITLNSHFSIFTSLYPHTHKMTEVLKSPLSEKYLTLAQIFRANGYQTIYHGPNGLHMPLDRGIGRGFNDISEGHLENWNEAYIKLIKNTEQNKPTFLFLHTYSVHDPYLTGHEEKHLFTDIPEYPHIPLTGDEYHNISPEFLSFTTDLILKNVPGMSSGYKEILSQAKQTAETLKKAKSFQEGKKIFETFPENLRFISFLIWNTHRIDVYDSNQINYLRALYDEEIYRLDKQLSELLTLMKDPRLSKNTILIITADHGEEFMEHGNLYHGSDLYRTQTQIPLIMHIPGVSPKKVQEMVQGIDIYPTALALTGLAPKSIIEGIDLSGLVLGEKNAKANKYLISEFQGITAIQDNNWRLYYEDKNKTPKELYNLTTDPKEQKNIIASNSNKVEEILKLVQ